MLCALSIVVALCQAVSACAEEPHRTVEDISSAKGDVSPAPKPAMVCGPGSGLPVHKAGCPDRHPETGWATYAQGRLLLKSFRMYHNDVEGESYAREHGLEYPFSNDYYDAPTGSRRPLELSPATVCTGIIQVGYREPLKDHVVDCAELAAVAQAQHVAVAVWRADGEIVQVSELYRP